MAWYAYSSSSSSSSSSSECGDDPAKEEYEDLDLNDISMLPAGSHGPRDGAAAEPTDDGRGADSSSDESEEPRKMSARAYQLEMLEESLKQNIIVTMGTGSGKTQVAVLRIIAELERSPPEQRVWFLAPTVALCSQQHDVLRSQIPAVQTRLLVGEDNIEAWSEQRIWDAVLSDVRIVVSTFQILLDALTHGFVKLQSLALVVIDEAHNCKGRHPGSRIMKEFYWPAKARDESVPAVLGLTASPVMGSQLSGLEELEKTLDAVCKSPKAHRDELMARVNRPEMHNVSYGPVREPTPTDGFTTNMLELHTILDEMDIKKDPEIMALQSENTDQSKRKLETLLKKRKTYVRQTLSSLCHQSVSICRDLGPWAADYYIREAVRRFITSTEDSWSWNVDAVNVPKTYLLDRLKGMKPVRPPLQPPPRSHLSGKVQTLLAILLSHQGDAVGIVFVKERGTVAVLTHLLSIHPAVKNKYRVGSMVGTSRMPGKRDSFLDLSRTEDLVSLEHFRSGKINLLVATSVLEEGIDVPACNLVICVDKPTSLKSFIQRRGRARMHSSHLYLLLDESTHTHTREWEELEAQMKAKYEDDMWQLQRLNELEESEVPDFEPIYVPSTGARLSIDDAKAHLEHFCAALSSRKYVDWKPDYIIQTVDDGFPSMAEEPLLRATVVLPTSLPIHLRRVQSSKAWRSERNACKDAAFQAYRALHAAGIVNDNLLPIKGTDFSGGIEGRPGVIDVCDQFNPWFGVSRAWADDGRLLHRRQLRLLDQAGSVMFQGEMILPIQIPELGPPLRLYWDTSSRIPWTVKFGGDTTLPPNTQGRAQHDDTNTLVAMSYGHRWPVEHRQSLVCLVSTTTSLSRDQIGLHPVPLDTPLTGPLPYMVRDSSHCPYIYRSWLPSKPPLDMVHRPYYRFDESPEDVPYLVVEKGPKKMGFFREQNHGEGSPSTKPYPRVLPAHETTIDSVPTSYVQFGALVPSLMHFIEIYLVAGELQTRTSLADLHIADLSLIATAISASSARNPTDYERIEFLGDSILKLCATINCAAQFLHFPEGYLSLMKDRLVSNARLCKAATQFGLDRFILTKQFTSHKWRPVYVDDMLKLQSATDGGNETRKMSTKVLADVVEALIGASYISGSLPTALHCIRLFLPEFDWGDIGVQREVLFAAAPAHATLPTTLEPLEGLIGYTFRRKSLLVEAMTHSSYRVTGTTACLERLEFLGDAILDNVVVAKLFAVEPPLPHDEMHLLRTALVNGDILGFLVLEWHISRKRYDVVVAAAAAACHEPPTVTDSDVAVPLWRFMRHSSGELGVEQCETEGRHAAMRDAILAAIREGTHYPWALLARLRVQKVFSDVFEALVGAVWVDSGSLEACEAVVERAGVLPYLRRILADGVHILHPKEELGRLADREHVDYAIESRLLEEGDRDFTCRVMIGERCWAEVVGGVSREEVKIKAAEAAVRAIKAERMAASVG